MPRAACPLLQLAALSAAMAQTCTLTDPIRSPAIIPAGGCADLPRPAPSAPTPPARFPEPIGRKKYTTLTVYADLRTCGYYTVQERYQGLEFQKQVICVCLPVQGVVCPM